MPQADFTRAVLDRNMTVNTTAFQKTLDGCDLTDLAILDFGSGTGNLLRLLRHSKAKVIYSFEVMPEHIAPDILRWAADKTARPRLIINPPAFKINPRIADGDLTNYNYFQLLSPHKRFAIIGNPPYFLYNRVLSLTGTNLAPGSEHYSVFANKFAGAVMITSQSRLQNHPGWEVKGVMKPADFNPPPAVDQYIIQTGLRAWFNKSAAASMPQPPQKYIGINDRRPEADSTDHYPEMWQQLNTLPRRTVA